MSQTMNMCLSGGAKGADTAWGIAAERAGHEVVHWSFTGHKSTANYICELSDTQLRVADHYLELANKNLHRAWPTKTLFVNNLIRRNFYQVYYSDRVYAVGTFCNDTSLLQIKGGTAWACQMFVDKWLYNTTKLNNIELYFFDQTSAAWYTWVGQWNTIAMPPAPKGIYAAIGTRELSDTGHAAINAVYG